MGEKKDKIIYLRPMTLADTDKIIAWRNADFVRTYFIYQKLFTKEIHENWFFTKVCTGQVVQFIICTEDGQEIGSVYLRDIDYEKKCAEYGVFIGEQSALRQGYGSACAKVMLDYAFRIMGLNRVYLRFLEDNLVARRCYEKVGFRIVPGEEEVVHLEQGDKKALFMEVTKEYYESK